MKKLFTAILFLLALTLFGCSEEAARPLIEFSDAPGIYQTRFRLKLDISDEVHEVRYTVDSSIPTVDSELYTDEGIDITYRGGGSSDPSSVNIIRCAAFDSDGNQIGGVLTGTYFLTDLPEVRYSTMIVSIVCEPDDLYGYVRGILVPGKIRDDFLKNKPSSWTNDSLQDANFFQSGREWERPAHIEFYSPTGGMILSQNGGIRVSGGWNRNKDYKSLRIFARYEYDDSNVFSFDAYPGLVSLTGVPVNDFKTLILRTGSNNFWDSVIQTQFLMELGDDLGIDTMEYRPVCLYVNGKYYGYMALFEDYSTTYFETNYNIPSDNVTCINGAGYIDGRTRAWQLDTGLESELREFKRVLNFIASGDMTQKKYYDRAAELIDLDNFIRYMCFEGYIANSDWPQNNVRLWRYNGGLGNVDYDDRGYDPDAEGYGFDGRWRFLLKDLDLAAGYGDNVKTSVFSRLNSDDGGLRLNAMFRSLFMNPDFKRRVYLFLCDLMSDTMNVENVMSTLGEVEASALLEMRYYTKSTGAGGGSNEKWHEKLLTPARFFYSRYDYVEAELEKKFDAEFAELKVTTEGEGELRVSTLTISGERELRYLAGLEVPVEAIPAKGWKLASLKYGSKEISDSFYMRGGSQTLTAVFEPDPDFAEPEYGVVINEIKYESPRSDTSPDLIELFNAGDKAVYLKGWRLVRERSEGGETKVKESALTAISIASGGYVTLSAAKENALIDFGLRSGDKLTLIDRMGNEIDSLTLPACGNYSILARDGDEWYFEPYATFGAENSRASGYELSSVIDDRARGTFIHKGKFVDLADITEDGLVISEKQIRDNFGAEKFNDNKSKFQKLGNGYELESVASTLGYRLWRIESLGSYVLYKK